MNTTNMRLLTDLPAGSVEPDRFQHDVYSRVLADIFASNRSGVCIGLLGKWGHGKSTIVNLLTKHLASDVQMVVFNAWKARGDSVRRQMLLTIMEKICPADEVTEFKKFADIYVVQSVIERAIDRKTVERNAAATICRDLFHDPWLAIPLWAAIVFILLSLVSVVGAFFASADTKDCFLTLGTAFFLPAFTAVIVYILAKVRERYSVLVGNIDQISESQKIRYPDQFRDIFVEKVNRFLASGQKNKLIIVVDDLDRCDPGTVIEALAAIRQFSDPQMLSQTTAENGKACQFLVPCDEQQVILALESDGYRLREDGTRYHDYQRDELLRKFFDIVVRMDPVPFSDLTEYAATLAGQIGVDAGEARELTDLVAASNPRQVKQLLNAYKVASERIRQSQTAPERMLPADELMPQKIRTLMALVALRETTPRVYDWLAEDYSRIADLRKDDFKVDGISERIVRTARSILTRAGDISPITAEYLMAGRYEQLLYDCPQAGALRLAVRKDDREGFAASLKSAAGEERERLRRWLGDQVNRCPTASRLTGYLSLFVSYASEGKDETDYILPVVDTCATKHLLITQALASFKYFDALAQLLPALAENSRRIILESILDNFLSDSASHNAELGVLLSSFSLLTSDQKRRFRNWIDASVSVSEDVKRDEFVARLVSSLPADTKSCWGLAPNAGVILAGKSWSDEKTAIEAADWPRPRLVPVLIGDNAKAAEQALINLFSEGGPLGNPAPISESSVGFKPGFLAAGEIIRAVDAASLSNVFACFEKWLKKQTEPGGAHIVLRALQSRLLDFGDREMGLIGDTLARLLLKRPGELSLCDYVGAKPKKRAQAEMWQRLCCSVFQPYAADLKSQSALDQYRAAILRRVGDLGWPVQDVADDLMAAKVQQLPNGTQDVEGWAKALKPLLAGSTEKTSAAVLQEISQRRQYIRDALLVGFAVLWTDTLDEMAARAIANWCSDTENQIRNVRDSLDKIAAVKGGGRMVEILVELLNEDRQWLSRHPTVLEFIGAHIGLTERECQFQFQRKIKQLILSDQEPLVTIGLNVLKAVQVLEPGVKAEIERLPKKAFSDAVKDICKSLLSGTRQK